MFSSSVLFLIADFKSIYNSSWITVFSLSAWSPEYGMGSEVSIPGDVYSYSILLLELFTGKRPTDDLFNEHMDLHAFAESALSGKVKEISDPMLLEEMHQTDEGVKTQDCLVSLFQIGVACSARSPKERTDIADVVTELVLIRSKVLQN